MRLRRYKDAQTELIKAISVEPHNSDAFAMLAYCTLKVGDWAHAKKHVHNAIGLNPASAYAQQILCNVALHVNDNKTAEEAAYEAIRLDPEDAHSYGLLGFALRITLQWEAALKAAENGLRIDPIELDCLNIRAEALSILGRTEEALEAARTTIRTHPEMPHSHTYAGWVVLRMGHAKIAAQHFREALRLDPEFEWAREGMIEALRARIWFYRPVIAARTLHLRLGRVFAFGILAVIGLLIAGLSLWDGGRLGPWFWIMALAGVCFVLRFVGILLRPLLNLAILLHPWGRIALLRDERMEAIMFGTLIASTAFSVLVGWRLQSDFIQNGMAVGFLALFATGYISLADPSLAKSRLLSWIGYAGAAGAFVITILGMLGVRT